MSLPIRGKMLNIMPWNALGMKQCHKGMVYISNEAWRYGFGL
ncbi:unnamed protein product, partial [marine sediment metagenome]